MGTTATTAGGDQLAAYADDNRLQYGREIVLEDPKTRWCSPELIIRKADRSTAGAPGEEHVSELHKVRLRNTCEPSERANERTSERANERTKTELGRQALRGRPCQSTCWTHDAAMRRVLFAHFGLPVTVPLPSLPLSWPLSWPRSFRTAGHRAPTLPPSFPGFASTQVAFQVRDSEDEYLAVDKDMVVLQRLQWPATAGGADAIAESAAWTIVGTGAHWLSPRGWFPPHRC